MSVLPEILRGFRRNILFIGGGYWAAEGVALATGVNPVPGDLTGVALGAAAAVLAYPSVHEGILRRIACRPRMTPEDYRQLRELEADLGWEPSEPCAPVKVPVPSALRPPGRQPARSKYLYGSVWSTSGSRAIPAAARVRTERQEPTIAEMERGQARYTVPWAMRADLGGGLWLHPRYTVHDRPGGTASMRVELRGDGYHVWSVAGEEYAPGGGIGADFLPVAVLEGKL